MLRIQHRVNTREQLRKTPADFGIEVDIRSNGNSLIVHHDPYTSGESFEEWLQDFHHQTLILNVKEEGLEGRLLAFMKDKNIEDFFFLDQSFPFLLKTANLGEQRCAVRVSEFESIDTAMALAHKVKWIWVDCFTHFPLNGTDAQRLKDSGFKLCFVSPELQGRLDPEHITAFRREIEVDKNIQGDAVCTKYPDLWA